MSKHPFLHDHFFKSIFQIKQVALEHVQDYIPPNLATHFDLNNFELDPTVYVNDKLRETRSDLVYKCPFSNGTSMLLALLHEHKSKQPVVDVRIQILEYKTSIWRKDEMQKQPLTFVLPSVIYNGKKKWNKQPFHASFPKLPKEMMPFLAEFDHLLVNLPALTDKEIIKKSEGKLLSTAFLTMKHGHEPNYFKKNFQKVLNFDLGSYPTRTWQTFFRSVLSYISCIVGFNRHELNHLAKDLPKPLNEFTMLTMESILEEGRQEGIVIGMEKGMEKGKEKHAIQVAINLLLTSPEWSDEKIAKVSGLTKKVVVKLRKELSENPKKGNNGASKK